MSNPDFIPEFGPNGAVMNAPTMTPEMRAKLEEAARPPTKSELGRGLIEIASPGLSIAFLMIGTKGINDLLKSSSWWAGAFAGATTVLVFLQIRRAAKFSLKRWELNANQRENRALDLPEWIRWLFVVTDTLSIATFVVALAVLLLDANRDLPLVWLWMVLAAGVLAFGGLAFRWYAEKCGWTWRIKPT